MAAIDRIVPLKTALILAKNGFDEECDFYYGPGMTRHGNKINWTCFQGIKNKNTGDDKMVSAPNLSQVADWLLEKHNVHIKTDMDILHDENGFVCKWFYHIRFLKGDIIYTVQRSDSDLHVYYDTKDDALLAGVNFAVKHMFGDYDNTCCQSLCSECGFRECLKLVIHWCLRKDKFIKTRVSRCDEYSHDEFAEYAFNSEYEETLA